MPSFCRIKLSALSLSLTSEGAAKERDRADSLIRQNEAIEVYINAQKNSNTQTQAQIGLLELISSLVKE